MHDTLTRGQGPRFEKIRHQPNVRKLRVRDVKAVTPAMRRVTLEGEDLHDFPSLGFDDHVKLVLPGHVGTPRLHAPALLPRGMHAHH